jgi:hypothetical protein
LYVGVLGKDAEGWGTLRLKESLEKRSGAFTFFSFSNHVARVGYRPVLSVNDMD